MTQGLLESQDIIVSYINRSCCQILSEDHTNLIFQKQANIGTFFLSHCKLHEQQLLSKVSKVIDVDVTLLMHVPPVFGLDAQLFHFGKVNKE